MITDHINFPQVTPQMPASQRRQLRQQIADQVAEYEAAGGQIRECDNGPGREARDWTWEQVRKPKRRGRQGGRRKAA